jgi:CBS-domain-containing membrane protein
MRAWQVGDVMTTDVAKVGAGTPYREIIDVVTGRHVNAVPVVDDFGRVLGVVSEADLLHKVELIGEPHERRVFEGRRRKAARVKADAVSAQDLMTSPAITTYAETSVVAAAKTMDRERVKTLPVVNDLGRLVGVVTRGDLLRVHLRPDAEIRRDIVEEVFRRILAIQDGIATVEVHDGVVTLTGRLGLRSSVEIAARFVANVSGVVALVNKLTFERDDSMSAEFSSQGHPMGVA